jgi:hypothetical protein
MNWSIFKTLLLVFIIITAFSACKDEDESSPQTWRDNPDAVTDKERIDEEQRIKDLIEASTTTDATTGLMWQDNNYTTQQAWSMADNYCSSADIVDFTDWRLPTLDEFVGLCERQSILETPDDLNSSGSLWWSSTSAGLDTFGEMRRYMVSFGSCNSVKYSPHHDFKVRCVRNGQ